MKVPRTATGPLVDRRVSSSSRSRRRRRQSRPAISAAAGEDAGAIARATHHPSAPALIDEPSQGLAPLIGPGGVRQRIEAGA